MVVSRLSFNQKLYARAISNTKVPMVVGIGPAGCGKTMIACQYAIASLMNKQINKIIITRPTIGADENIGYLPGNADEKMTPWMMPIFEFFKEYTSKQTISKYIESGTIEICPLSFMRGRTFHDSFIIADEIQNTTSKQFKMLTTRIGNNSKLIVSGDVQQSDIGKDNGLSDFLQRYNLHIHYNGPEIMDTISVIEFQEDDVHRSKLVKKMLEIYKQTT